MLFESYRRSAPPVLKRWVQEATTILVESGIGVLILRDLRAWNPSANIIYLASDDLSTIDVDPYLRRLFSRSGALIDGVRVPSRQLAAVMPNGPTISYVPHGIEPELGAHGDPSPYGPGEHAVSVGSMLFDPGFFHIAAKAFPKVTFHVIGCGASRSALPPAVAFHPEMPFRQTLPFLKHARFGIAPYRRATVPYYLADTSMKLMQYAYFGLPAVCPDFVVGEDNPLRFGYSPGDGDSIKAAIAAALATPRDRSITTLTWGEVVDRILYPESYSDTAL